MSFDDRSIALPLPLYDLLLPNLAALIKISDLTS